MILKKEDIKVGDWVTNENLQISRKVVSINNDTNSYDVGSLVWDIKSCSKWTPQSNEACVFWNNGSNTRMIGEFLMTDNASGKHRTINNDFYDHIAPLVFDTSVYGLEV